MGDSYIKKRKASKNCWLGGCQKKLGVGLRPRRDMTEGLNSSSEYLLVLKPSVKMLVGITDPRPAGSPVFAYGSQKNCVSA